MYIKVLIDKRKIIKIDLTDLKFGKWTVLKKDPIDYKWDTQWICVCECGKDKSVSSANLRRGSSRGCRICMQKNRWSKE